ncbi:MAG: glycosyltransferase, partial [Anaerolineae bacterium]|nr:glycosyltransferase [Anaerolineae bacterium]
LALRPPGRDLTLITAARLAPYKGLDYLLEAFAQLRVAHPDVHLKIYGDGPLRVELLSHAQRLGLDGDAIFVGTFERDALTEVLLQADIFVLPSAGREALPAALIEALAHGRPIVATTVGGVPDLIDEGVSGLLCAPADATCLARKLSSLIEDFALRVRLGQAARQAYEAGPFHADAVCEQHLSVYRATLQLAQERAGTPGERER